MSKPDDYLWDGSGEADPDVAQLEGLLRPLAHDRPLDEVRLRRTPPRRRAPWIAGGVALLAAAALLVLVLRPRAGGDGPVCESGEGFAFRAPDDVMCSGDTLAQGVLPVGGVLDTGAQRVELTIADIGSAVLSEQTRVRLSRTEKGTRHELHLERGKMHAKVLAPPRIFAVTTPSTNVVDLGCEYTIEIDEQGAGSIEVQTGMVELESAAGAVVVAPAGTGARLLAGRKPSLPIATSASAEVRAAVVAYEHGEPAAFDRVLRAAVETDAITIVNLASLSTGEQRVLALVRLASLLHPPDGVDVQSAAQDPAALARWRDDVITVHFGEVLLEETKTPDH